MGNLLMRYLRLAVREAHLARVPNQFVSDNGQSGQEEQGSEEEQHELDEFSGVGGGNIVGFTGPLGGKDAKHPTASVGKRRK